MSGVRAPPKIEKPSRAFFRFIMLLLMTVVAGVVVWGSVTDQRIGLVESVAHSSLELEAPATAQGLTLNVVEHQGGPIPVVLLHDADLAGGAVFDQAVAGLPARFRAIVVDLPGFGLSQRIQGQSGIYTVAGMADVVAEALEELVEIPAVFVGVGYGGEVASEIAVSHSQLVRGLVLVDVNFWPTQGWLELGERLPLIGRPIAFTFEGAGPLGVENWAPNCEAEGWCPTESQLAARALAVTIEGSTDSLLGYRATLPSSLVPSSLPEITVPVAYIWSQRGTVTEETIERLNAEIIDVQVIESDSWMAHVDAPEVIGAAVDTVSP